MLKKPSTGATSHLGRHLKSCPVKLRADALKNRDNLMQSHISFSTSSVDPLVVSVFDGTFDMEKDKVDSTYEMLAIAIKCRDVFPRYADRGGEAVTELAIVRRTLHDLYSEYVSMCNAESNTSGEDSTSCQSSVDARNVETGTLLSKLAGFLKEKQSVQPQNSELDMYLDENCFIKMENGKDGIRFDVLDWWKIHALKYKVLSTMARDNLAIPITTVASESTFSAESRVIDK
ncbi:hypothetical protein BUALT_Bualt04G0042400 [Buddleja alternifolia]|uniref:HAT C-terminal dimerisation domain-containing protein n=1 Tax=Buddleja alternifolia TaxID=168488 RepID=A0AAV6XSS3_9LAMI|nr:hypothetical protein BUALT_Bualt04G0042400 [Buddleja alternifolia]